MSDAGQGVSPGGFLKSFHADDVFSALAWFCTTVAIILATIANPLNYKSSSTLVGESPMPSAAELADTTITLRKWNIAGQTLFWTGLYCVKFSFMFLYRLMFGENQRYRLAWTLVVTTDLALVILPMPIIWRLNMHVKQKLAVTAICGLALIIIAFETVRTVRLYTETFTLTNLYSYLKLLIVVIISMLPSYRFLVSSSDKDREYRQSLQLFWLLDAQYV
ncbi:hypothetical protein F5X98DRAFT_379020 [Xylaria grammica]|nr:hypothetical protein F5X98DRAFT_379020 [Xylaria grammica]